MKSLVNSIYVAATLVLIPVSLPAQNEADKPTSRLKLGQIEGDVQYSKLTPSLLHFVGRITLTSDEYDLAAEDIKVFLHPGKGGASSKSAIEKATADGNSGKQVDVHVRRPLQSEAYEILADHAVYLPGPVAPRLRPDGFYRPCHCQLALRLSGRAVCGDNGQGHVAAGAG